MKDHLRRLASEIDSAVALGIALVMSVLGLFSVTSTAVLNSSILITLTVLAFCLFRDRWQRSATVGELSEKLDQALEQSGHVRVISGSEIRRAFAAAQESTQLWMFKGATGTYTRAVTFHKCFRLARERRHSLQIRLKILDPTDVNVCERYANFRRSVSGTQGKSDEQWTTTRVREELYATILATC
jgi:hypothetical protein